jgi:hypothetical protein
MMVIETQKLKLKTKVNVFTWIGGISAFFALIPLIWAGIQVLGNQSFFKENELGDFIGGTSGTFASFAALAFVYVGFLGQQLQILFQQEELEMNRQELKETREEIRGQKEQLELQNRQFEKQSFENVFFNLLELFRKQSHLSFSKDYGDELLMEKAKKFYGIIRTDHFHDDWISISDREKAIKLGDGFDFAFSRGYARVRSLIHTALGILIHLDKNRVLIDHEYYLSLFTITLDIHETRILFYGYFSGKVHFNLEQESLYKEFLGIFISENLIFPEDIKLLI